MMLYQFVNSNRDELILRCREKVTKRFPPIGVPAVVEHGVPMAEGPSLDVLAREPNRRAVGQDAGERELFGRRPVNRRLLRIVERASPAIAPPLELAMHVEAVGRDEQRVVELAKPIDGHGGHRGAGGAGLGSVGHGLDEMLRRATASA